MIRSLENRINKLEDKANIKDRKFSLIIRECGETKAAATEKYFAKHPDEVGNDLIIVGWKC